MLTGERHRVFACALALLSAVPLLATRGYSQEPRTLVADDADDRPLLLLSSAWLHESTHDTSSDGNLLYTADAAPADGPEQLPTFVDTPQRPLATAAPTDGEILPLDSNRATTGTDPTTDLEGYDAYAENEPGEFRWQVGPSGIIYRSYLAGPHEPRIGITPFFSSNHSYWDATVGGRGGVVRYGDDDPLHPQGWQLDVYGAAIVRMDAENHQDLNGCDYVFGFPLTYGVGNWQFKMGYSHLSSHLGDEYAIRYPGTLDERINYVRDGLVFGSSWYPIAICRLYGEFDWAFHNSGGSEPLAFQFGTELSEAGPTGLHGTPFAAFNGRMRQDVDYGGDVTVQSGWLWRGETGKVFRIGAHYYNGKSSQSQWFDTWEEQIGMGIWYDF